jgi:hypothetical protein
MDMPRLRADVEQAQRRLIVDVDRHAGRAVRQLSHARPVFRRQTPSSQVIHSDCTQVRGGAVHQLPRGHLLAQHQPALPLCADVQQDLSRERGFPDARASGQHNDLAGLETAA